MEDRGGELTCIPGAMSLSQALEQSLTARFAASVHDLEDPRPARYTIGGRWYCPADGTAMREDAGVIACPRCSRSLTGSQIFQLIELHPHREVKAGPPGA
jgi:hypothetical protein